MSMTTNPWPRLTGCSGESLLQCQSWVPVRCKESAEGWLVTPEGDVVGGCCRQHGEAVVKDYAAKLHETWRYVTEVSSATIPSVGTYAEVPTIRADAPTTEDEG